MSEQPKTFTDFAGVEWLYVENPDLGGDPVRIHNSPDVVEHFAARGWQPVDAPDETTPTVAKAVDVPEGGEWIELVHPDLDARHLFPNHPDALAGAAEAGWVEPNKDGSTPSPRTAKARAKARTEPSPAADEAASSEDTENPDADPAPETAQDEAGDSTATTKEG